MDSISNCENCGDTYIAKMKASNFSLQNKRNQIIYSIYVIIMIIFAVIAAPFGTIAFIMFFYFGILKKSHILYCRKCNSAYKKKVSGNYDKIQHKIYL